MIVYVIYDKCCKERWSLSAHLLMRFHDNARSTWLTFFEKSIGAILTKNRMKLWWKWIISDAPPNQITADHVSVHYVMQRKGSFSYKQFGLLDSCWWDKQSSRRRKRSLSTSRTGNCPRAYPGNQKVSWQSLKFLENLETFCLYPIFWKFGNVLMKEERGGCG